MNLFYMGETKKMIPEFRLDGKIALVTGAASGIGAACAEVLAEAGAAVMLTDINEAGCHAFASQLAERGFEVRSMQQDVAEEKKWESVISATIDQLGGLDILVNNAGIVDGALLEQDTLDQLQRLNRVNVESIFLGMKYAALAMKPDGSAGRGGSIINLSSVAGLFGTVAHSAYGATKGAVRSYTKHAAAEFGSLGYGIRVNSIHPGVIETPMGDSVAQSWADVGIVPSVEAAVETVKSMTSLGRTGKPRDIGLAALYLASDAAAYVTGSELVVDGGMSNR